MRSASALPFRLVCLLTCAAALAQQPFHLKDGDTVVFYGDSITDQRLYTTFVETFAVTRYPRMQVKFVHSGWGGDRVSGGSGGPIDHRLERDVFPYKPTVMTIMLGMNDASYRPFDPAIFDEYRRGYEHIVDRVKQKLPGIRITVIQPSPFDDVTQPPQFEGGYNGVLVRYGDFLKGLAAQKGLTVADLNTTVVAALTQAKSSDPERAKKIVPDRVHPDAAGHLIMAAALLEAWNAAPVVTSVEIDGGSVSVRGQSNTEVRDLKQSGTGLSWTERDRSLPMPVNLEDSVMALAVQSSNFLERLDRQMLRVTGLPAPGYTLRINGESAGVLSAAQLAAGVNLAALPTPMMKQAAAVHALTLKRAGVHNTRWRNLQAVFEKDPMPRVQTIMDSLDALDAEMSAQQRQAAQPGAFRYELTPQ